jgi:hypothetical protein
MAGSSVVYSADRIWYGGAWVTILTTGTAVKELGITKVTLYKWIKEKKIVPIVMKSDSGRTQYVFDVREIERVKKLLKKGWKPGDKKYGG